MTFHFTDEVLNLWKDVFGPCILSFLPLAFPGQSGDGRTSLNDRFGY